MSDALRQVRPQRTARFAGACYLVIAVIAMTAYVGVFERLGVEGDVGATAANVAAAEPLFRLGLAGLLSVLALDVVVAWAFYVLMRPAGPTLSLLAAWLRLTYVFVHGAALLSYFDVLALLDGLAGFDAAQTDALVAAKLDAYAAGFTAALIFFGCHLLLLGYLVFRARFLPKIFGVLLALGGLGYVVDGFGYVLLGPGHALSGVTSAYMMVSAMAGEFSFLLWLLIRGVNADAWRAQAA